jgi:glycosyltransferase involved in cell wall biosynthesis
MNPLVSILVPCFNAARWVEETLECAVAQTWRHTEVIVVDDGSTDGSRDILHRFERRGVRVATNEHRGAAAARNRALELSRGEYLQYLDADDLISPEKIALQIELLSRRPPGTVATCRWGRFETDHRAARFVDAAVFRDFAPVDFLTLAGKTGAMMHPSAWLTPRAVADAAGSWNQNLTLNDDGEYFTRVALASSGLAFCDDPRARSFYRSAIPGSLSQRRDDRARRSQFLSLELIGEQLRRAEDSPRTRAARAGMWRRYVHDFFPNPPELIAQAEAEVKALGEELGDPPMGRKSAMLARLMGWRNLRRLERVLGR